jgi:hypothetical protein
MKLTDDHKVQIFSAALSATLQTLIASATDGRATTSNTESAVAWASQIAKEAIETLQGGALD